MALYDVSVGGLPQASDVSQLVDIFNGYHDIGQITFAPQVVAPTTTGFSLLAQSGSTLGVGAYNYQFSYVTGYYKSDGTLVVTGETTVSPALPITTASGSTTVKVTLPLPGPISIVATRIYRTAVGGSTYGLIATIKDGSTTYTDSTADGSRGAAPSVSNTTGTNLTVNGDVKVGAVAATANPLQLIVQNWSNASAGSAQIIGGWQGANYWGIGTDSSSGDLTVQIGNTNISGTWQSTPVDLLVTGNLGSSIAPQYGLHTLGGQARIQALATPSAPTVTTVGTAGTTSYSYYVVATDNNGFKTLPSPVKTIATGNATLSGSNYNTITWAAVPGAVSYDVLKADTGHSIATGVTGTSYNDQGSASSAYTTPTRNTTADLNIDGLLYGAVPYIFIASSTTVTISSLNTLTNVPINNSSFLGQAGNADLTLGHDANGDYIYVPHGGVYAIQVQLFISGLNNNQTFQFLARRYLANGTYGDDQQLMYGWSGLGGNQGTGKQGIPFTYQSAWSCDAGDKIYFWTQCSEAPRTINGYNILIQKVG